ncbi:MAG: transporter, partial [Microbacteriaceae bacterium]|nr:transporter [Microbacteriaceae bacterium]
MVAHLIRLRFLILANSLKKSPWQIVATVLGAVYGVVVLGLVVAGLFVLSFGSIEIARTITVIGGSVAILGWMLVPLVAAGVDQTIDPSRLATFPIPLNTLLAGLAISGVLGVAGVVTLIASLATALTWVRYPLAALAAIICAAVAALTCVVGSRAVAAMATGLGSGRRFREARGILLFIPLVLLGPIFFGLGALFRGSDAWPTLARVLGWTPLGAIWAVPSDIATGDFGRAGLEFL